jgi:high affinity Mn2+ porin
MRRNSIWIALALLCGSRLAAQPADAEPQPDDQASENWNLYYQATSIGMTHGMLYAPYSGPLSLQDYRENDASLTTTLFFDARLAYNLQLVFDPEIAGGRGFSGVNGLANPPNGELPRVASATPKPYIARLFLTYDIGWGSEKEHFESDENQLAGDRPLVRYTITVGRFSLTDYFDNNDYSHDPRTQFMAWAVMYNGAWDYAADTRGYTWGWVHELHTRSWSFRYASAAEPTFANGPHFDTRIFVDRGDQFEGERRYSLRKHPGVVRVLEYFNHTHSGSYAEAIKLAEETGTTPNIDAVRQYGTLKYGTGVNLEQEIAPDVGFFIRLGWNDGKTQDFAFTAMDRLASGGVSIKGTRWRRKNDTVGSAFTAAGISGVHALYLAMGGLDFLIGDGRLSYAPEYNWETYYSAHLFRGFFASVDFQHDTNPAYNHARGPVWIESLRLHTEFGLHPWPAK